MQKRVGSSSKRLRLELIKALHLFLLCAAISSTSLAQDAVIAKEPALACDLDNVKETHLKLNCTLDNSLAQDIYILTGDATLEGPSDDGDGYIYLYIDGQRCENVLQYNKSSTELDLPILFKPVIYPTLKQIENLRRVPSGKGLGILVFWNFGPRRMLLAKNRWIMRIKVVYLLESSLDGLLKGESVIDQCKESLRVAAAAPDRSDELELAAVNFVPGQDHGYFGCRDVISYEFKHLYSNTLQFSLPGSFPK